MEENKIDITEEVIDHGEYISKSGSETDSLLSEWINNQKPDNTSLEWKID